MLSKPFLNATLVTTLVTAITGCSYLDQSPADDGLGSSEVAITMVTEDAARVLALVNHPATDFVLLDDIVRLDSRAARNIVDRRNGSDGIVLTEDDGPFLRLAELDAVAYVGDTAFQRLLAYAKSNPSSVSESVENVEFSDWQSEAVVWGVNNADLAELDALLDARAARSLLEGVPYDSVTEMGARSWVGPRAMDQLRSQAT